MAQALAWSQAPGQHLLTLADPRYPPMIAALPDPPPVLYLRGDPEALNRPAIALVGSRNATRDGLEIAQSVASAFARTGIVIASGLAAGIDSAHASAVIVVQAARHSGSLITARLAADLGREVAAFPGSVHSALSRGCHQLIREGAALVEDAADIAALLESAFARQGWQPKAFPAPISRAPSADHSALSEPASQLLASLGWSPVTPDSLVQASGLPGPQAANALIELELSGLVERLIDGRFQRMRPAS
jgi:DNA processing protein